MNTEKRAFTTSEAASYCGISESLLRQARMTGPKKRRLEAPQSTKLGGRKIVYLREDLDAWLDSHRELTAEASQQ